MALIDDFIDLLDKENLAFRDLFEFLPVGVQVAADQGGLDSDLVFRQFPIAVDTGNKDNGTITKFGNDRQIGRKEANWNGTERKIMTCSPD